MWLRTDRRLTLVKTSVNLLRGILWLVKELVVYQERLCSNRLAGWLVSTSPFTIKSFRIFCCNLRFIFKHFAVAASSRNIASGVRDVSLEMTILFVATQILSANFVPFATQSPI
jgi:hypothetical protein